MKLSSSFAWLFLGSVTVDAFYVGVPTSRSTQLAAIDRATPLPVKENEKGQTGVTHNSITFNSAAKPAPTYFTPPPVKECEKGQTGVTHNSINFKSASKPAPTYFTPPPVKECEKGQTGVTHKSITFKSASKPAPSYFTPPPILENEKGQTGFAPEQMAEGNPKDYAAHQAAKMGYHPKEVQVATLPALTESAPQEPVPAQVPQQAIADPVVKMMESAEAIAPPPSSTIPQQRSASATANYLSNLK